MAESHSFLWLSNTPLHVQACVYTYIHIYHSSVDGHLGCFCILAIVIMLLSTFGSMYIFKLLFFFSNIYLRAELLNHMIVLYLVF